jgi:O-acetyl-ADP-ribose deacetylase (regulator of RNase III)
MKHLKGDLLQLARDGKFNIIVHGCNCFCTMGGGIARQVREEYPDAYQADCETTKGDKAKLGTYTFTRTSDGFVIINAYTQYDFNRPGESDDVFDYSGFEIILANLAYEAGDMHFGFPYIGMGLAGGDKKKIIELLEDFNQRVEDQGGSVTLVEYAK